MLKVLFFGDVYGRPGRRALKKAVPKLKKHYDTDIVIANVENAAHGVGITKKTLAELMDAGIDFATSGNHIFNRKDGIELLNEKDPVLIRPANYPPGAPGVGYKIIPIRTQKLLVVNVMGRVFMKEDLDCPFRAMDTILDEVGSDIKNIVVDFHAEVTSEMIALGMYLDGRVSAVFGTHTHVPTQDFKILPGGTAYVTDVGMVGPTNSVLGVDKDIILRRYLTQMSESMEVADSPQAEVNAVYFEIDSKGKASKIEKIYEVYDV
ncbi:TIGR00282 family metallophosphoesterase [Patescibacteria group bacterium]|nr:TIGR00282 family metallophosphoesterase [Patescibacteria group bacterium]